MKTHHAGSLSTRAIPQLPEPGPRLSQGLERTLVMDSCVDLLLNHAKARLHWPELYQKSGEVLASLPIPADKYGRARACLSNAQRYAAAALFGATAFELRQLRGLLL